MFIVYTMSKQYEKTCNRCDAKIRMSDESGKWLPYNKDNTAHECKPKRQNESIVVTTNRNGNGNNNDISLELVLKKLESIGITLDLTKLRNATNGEIIKH